MQKTKNCNTRSQRQRLSQRGRRRSSLIVAKNDLERHAHTLSGDAGVSTRLVEEEERRRRGGGGSVIRSGIESTINRRARVAVAWRRVRVPHEHDLLDRPGLVLLASEEAAERAGARAGRRAAGAASHGATTLGGSQKTENAPDATVAVGWLSDIFCPCCARSMCIEKKNTHETHTRRGGSQQLEPPAAARAPLVDRANAAIRPNSSESRCAAAKQTHGKRSSRRSRLGHRWRRDDHCC